MFKLKTEKQMKKFKIEIANRFTGDVIFTYESEEKATIKEAVKEAVKSDAYLSGADLRGADLSDAYLRGADLRGADLRDADLRGADLRDADLRGADLSDAYLRGADLRGAEKIPIYCKWSHGITEGKIHIGCEKRTIDEWDVFFASNDEIETLRNTDEFKQIEAVYNAYKAYLQTLENK